jgi:ubiquinol-cytochrome c reductase cytochrome c1 subunit
MRSRYQPLASLPAAVMLLLAASLASPRIQAGEPAAVPGINASAPVQWESWRSENEVADLASLQRGARNFMNYCNGCHSLRYMRYQRMGDDLRIPADVLKTDLVAPGSNSLDYIGTPMTADAVNWFGKQPPDLSLMVRYKGAKYIYQLFKTYYLDPSQPSGVNNLAYPNVAMPAVLSSLGGVQQAVFRNVRTSAGTVEQQFDHFETVSPGSLTPEQYDDFVRDTVNFLDYVSEPVQDQRRSMGIWVVLFLLTLTGFAYLLKKEYWKEVH